MRRNRLARQDLGQATHARGGRKAGDAPIDAGTGRDTTEPRDGECDATAARLSVVDDGARTAVLAVDFETLDPKGRLQYLRRALQQPDELGNALPITDRDEAGKSADKRPEDRLLYQHARRALRNLTGTCVGLPERLSAAYRGTLFRKLAKSALGLAVVIIVGWGPAQRLMQTTSVEAIVNARLVTLRTPIEGQVAPDQGRLTIGASVMPGTALLRIVNPRADRTRLDELRRLIERLQHERPVLVAKLENARAQHAQFVEQTRLFQDGRVRQLEARIAEITSEIAVATARREDAADVLERTEALAAKGYQTRASLDRARRELTIADQLIVAAQQRDRGARVELEAARVGTFVGDSYNDRPRSSQRADELQQQIAELSAQLRQSDARSALLEDELVEEKVRFANLAEAAISAPSNGRVWEVLTAPGEQVNRGQDLLRMLDCSTAVVTATVSESVYNRLQMGAPARFRFRDGGEDLEGYITQLTGVAEAPANLAIAPSSLIKEAYRVTVQVPALTRSATCHLGRTGRVVFGDTSGTAASAAASRQ